MTVLFVLVSCGKEINTSTSFIVEDERSWDHEGKTSTFIMLPETSEGAKEEEEEQHQHQHKEDQADQVEIVPETFPALDSQESLPTTLYEVLEQTDSCSEYPSQKDIMEFGHAIEKLGGSFANPGSYQKDLIGFTKFLSDVGVKHFSAYEIVTPGNKNYARSCGIKILLPNKGCWLRSATLALIADKVRGNQGKAVKLTSHLRTSCYNKKVGGSRTSDHLSSRAVDLSFGSKSLRRKAQKFICETFWKDDLIGLNGLNLSDTGQLNISIGLGQSFMHVGLGSKQGRRYWIYKSYKNGGNIAETCWTKKL